MNTPPFSGNPLLDLDILSRLSDPDLFQACQSNRYLAGLCRDELFWKQRFLSRYGVDIASDLGPYETYRQAYINMAMPSSEREPERILINAANHGYLSLLNEDLPLGRISPSAPYRTFTWIKRHLPASDKLVSRLLMNHRLDAADLLLRPDRIDPVARHYIYSQGQIQRDQIDWLLEHGLQLDQPIRGEQTLADLMMTIAASRGDLPLVIYFVRKGADPRRAVQALREVMDGPTDTAMEIARYLVQHGTDPSTGLTEYPFEYRGNPEVVRYLIEQGGRVSALALEEAAEHGSPEMLRAYLTDPNLTLEELLMALAQVGDEEKRELLYEQMERKMQ